MPWPRRNPPANPTQPAKVPQAIVNCRPTLLANVVVSICRQDHVVCAKVSKELNRLTEMAKRRRAGTGVGGALGVGMQGTKRKEVDDTGEEWGSVVKRARFEVGSGGLNTGFSARSQCVTSERGTQTESSPQRQLVTRATQTEALPIPQSVLAGARERLMESLEREAVAAEAAQAIRTQPPPVPTPRSAPRLEPVPKKEVGATCSNCNEFFRRGSGGTCRYHPGKLVFLRLSKLSVFGQQSLDSCR
jgi:hypothetical protein